MIAAQSCRSAASGVTLSYTMSTGWVGSIVPATNQVAPTAARLGRMNCDRCCATVSPTASNVNTVEPSASVRLTGARFARSTSGQAATKEDVSPSSPASSSKL